MIKLKDLIKEEECHCGDSCCSTKEQVNEEVITEKKEVKQVDIDKLAKLTDRNAHTSARRYLAKLIGHKKLVKMYDHISELHLYFNDINDIKDARARLDKELFDKAKRQFSNFKDVYGAF
tara:strand:+ start:1962 stop:2321 length:360 start_codon:yes stop_codon:yes gene_type:complete